MKTKFKILGGVLLLLLVSLMVLPLVKEKLVVTEAVNVGEDQSHKTTVSERAESETSPSDTSVENESIANGRKEEFMVQSNKFKWFLDRYKTPIEFFGKVVDQNDNPLPGATINFGRTDESLDGYSTSQTVSDSMGLFSLLNSRGKNLQVSVLKDGYYQAGSSFEFFDSGDHSNFKPDSNNPVVFQLRRKGTGAALITSEYGIRPDLTVKVTRDGSPVFVDFFNRKVGSSGQIKVEFWSEPRDTTTGKNDWALRLSVPSGGLIQHDQEFPFEAPETNYQAALEWRFTKDQSEWKGFLDRKLFIRFGEPPIYGRFTLKAKALSSTVYLEYAINPDGSRYLEPK